MQETSLRTRRGPSARNATLPPALQVGISRAPRSRVDDRIKKRMSSRYSVMMSSPPGSQPIPPVPRLPTEASEARDGTNFDTSSDIRGGEGMRDRTGIQGLEEDKKVLDDEKFDPDTFLKSKLANSTEAQLKSLQSSLHNIKDDINSELQQSVFRNYADFVLISKEITTLETEMLELKDLLSEYKYMPFLLHIPDPTMQSSNPNIISTYKRSSVADLRVMYQNQMQELHATIEGSSKFVPTIPGRHVISEVDYIMSLNPATYKEIGRVRFVILDDLVLVARRRRRKTNMDGVGGGSVNEGKLVAERCWPLNEMMVLDTKDSPRITNMFKIKRGKETHVYRTEQPQDKRSLLAQFRQVAEELAAKKRKEREGEHERRKSTWNGGSGGGDRFSMPPMPDWMADLVKKGGDIPGIGLESLGAKEKTEQDARWLSEWTDDLTVAIALKEWEKAVQLVEKGQTRVAVVPPLVQKLPSLSSTLISALLGALSLPSVRKSSVVSIISYLCRLKASLAARETFLQMRSKVIKTHVRKIKFDGNIVAYVGDLAVVYFTGIKHTADWFLASFRENEVASAFVDWAKGQIEEFSENFRKQVFTSDFNRKLLEDAITLTHVQSRKLLQEYGLDFKYLLDALLVENPKSSAQSVPQVPPLDSPPPTPVIETVPISRRRAPSPIGPRPSDNLKSRLPVFQSDNLPLPTPARSAGLSPNVQNAGSLLSAPASGYSSTSNYSHPSPVGSEGPNRSDSGRSSKAADQVPSSFANPPFSGRPRSSSRSHTPVSGVRPGSRPRTPVSPAPPHPGRTPPWPRTPSAAPPPPPTMSTMPQQFVSSMTTVADANDMKEVIGNRDSELESEREGERSQHTQRPVKIPAVPPRSLRRPGSTDVNPRLLPLRQGMF